jgi:hypothetical protein
VFVAVLIGAALLFFGGMSAYVFDFRHRNVCANGRQWVARSDDYMGATVFLCPGGQTVTQGMFP